MSTNPRLRFRNNIARDPASGLYHVRKVIHGKPVQRAFPTKRSATLYLEHLCLLAAGVQMEEEAVTIDEARLQYVKHLELLNRSDATRDYYGLRLRPLMDHLGKDSSLAGITQGRIEAYVRERKTQVSAGTINKELRALRTIYKHAKVDAQWSLPALSHQPRRRRVHAPERIRSLWAILSPEARVPFGLCLLAGLRASEAMAAQPDWVDGDELMVPIRKTAGWNRTHIVGTLREAIEAAPLPIRVTERALSYELGKASEKVGIAPPILGPGAGRHHCATWAVDAGHGRDRVKEVLSHASGSVTDRYVHSQALQIKKAVLESVEKALLGVTQT